MTDHNSPEAVAARANQEDPIVMYLIVRESLGMSIGKTAAQCAHASQMLILKHQEELDYFDDSVEYPYTFAEQLSLFKEWLNTSFRKVVLRADDKEWAKIKEEFKDKLMVVVVDAGLTEIASGSETVIGLWPMRKSEVPKIVKRLQVLK
jgi:peptidyl-tRNA hydrolase, PTH2 family